VAQSLDFPLSFHTRDSVQKCSLDRFADPIAAARANRIITQSSLLQLCFSLWRIPRGTIADVLLAIGTPTVRSS
jgi:hypothetical protein